MYSMIFTHTILKTFFLFCSVHAAFIKNAGLPSCRNCVHYNPPFHSDYSSELSRCKYFGTKSIQTDEINYDFASHCRRDEEQCGLEGKYFEEEKNVELKIFLHGFMKNLPINMCFFVLCVNAYLQGMNMK